MPGSAAWQSAPGGRVIDKPPPKVIGGLRPSSFVKGGVLVWVFRFGGVVTRVVGGEEWRE